MIKTIKILYWLFLKPVKIGQVWRFQTKNPDIYMDYKIIAKERGYVKYETKLSTDYCTIYEFKIGCYPL